MEGLTVIKTEHPKEKPAKGAKLGFGVVFTDHMLIMQYDKGQGWHDAKIVPYGPITISPASTVLHYAQETFEGMKAYRAEDGRVLLFRPEENFKRLNISNERLCDFRHPEIHGAGKAARLHQVTGFPSDLTLPAFPGGFFIPIIYGKNQPFCANPD